MRALIEDTRNQVGRHAAKNERWAAEGVAVVRSKLAFGDYALAPPVAVDTKRSIQELAMDIDREHDRFRRECVGARDAGCRLVVLTENSDGVSTLSQLAAWVEPDESFRRRRHAVRKISGLRIAKACMTMSERYGVEFAFCAPDEAADEILRILAGGGGDG